MRYRDLHGRVYHRGKANITRLPFFKSHRDSFFMQGDYSTDPNTDEEAGPCEDEAVPVHRCGEPRELGEWGTQMS
jgi:hypothetical protein